MKVEFIPETMKERKLLSDDSSRRSLGDAFADGVVVGGAVIGGVMAAVVTIPFRVFGRGIKEMVGHCADLGSAVKTARAAKKAAKASAE
jgi:hypothetical protein